MSEHTKEPWRVGFDDGSGDSYITSCSDETVVVRGGTDDWGVSHGATDPANARRIVACVNACAGISTEFLESVPPRTVKKLIENSAELDRMERQRDLLLTAIERIATIDIDSPTALQDCIGAAAMALAATGATQ